MTSPGEKFIRGLLEDVVLIRELTGLIMLMSVKVADLSETYTMHDGHTLKRIQPHENKHQYLFSAPDGKVIATLDRYAAITAALNIDGGYLWDQKKTNQTVS